MAVAIAEFMSEFRDEPIIVNSTTDGEDSYMGCHDRHNGNFILAKCIGSEEGADVYFFDNVSKIPQEAINKVGKLLVSENVHTHLLPWFKTEEFSFTLDSGEPGGLVIAHRPTICVIGQRLHPDNL